MRRLVSASSFLTGSAFLEGLGALRLSWGTQGPSTIERAPAEVFCIACLV